MSKIAETKAFEAYPEHGGKRECYIKGYDQAMQYFLEKACEWLEDTELENFICLDDGVYFDNEKLIEQFKNYMQNES